MTLPVQRNASNPAHDENQRVDRKRNLEEVVQSRAASVLSPLVNIPSPQQASRDGDEEVSLPGRISSRKKQILLGFAQHPYVNMKVAQAALPYLQTSVGNPLLPPDVTEDTTKRQFEGSVRAWKRDLHKWDDLSNEVRVIASLGLPEIEAVLEGVKGDVTQLLSEVTINDNDRTEIPKKVEVICDRIRGLDNFLNLSRVLDENIRDLVSKESDLLDSSGP